MTEENQEPGPSTTQSASSTACTASGTAGGSAGTTWTSITSPGVSATVAWPRTVEISSGRSGWWPRTMACRSSGTADIGSTRPCAPSSRPTHSRAATSSLSCSHSATISRLPTAWPCRSPLLTKRCWITLAQVLPHSSSPHRAASALRRSPGGSTPISVRSLPLEPPSSATVTTAVRSPVIRRSAASEAASPWPPPRATTFGGTPERRPTPRRPRRPVLITRAPCPCAPSPSPLRPPRAVPRVVPTSPRCGACRPYSRRRSSHSACPRAGSPPR